MMKICKSAIILINIIIVLTLTSCSNNSNESSLVIQSTSNFINESIYKNSNCNEKDKIQIIDFTADTFDINVNKRITVTFFATIKNAGSEEIVVIDDEDNIVGKMIALGNCKYSLVTELVNTKAECKNYYSKVLNIKSNAWKINFYSDLSENDIEKSSNIKANIEKIVSAYRNEEGYIEKSNISLLKNDLSVYLNNEKTLGNVSTFEISDNSVMITLPSRYNFAYLFNKKYTD